MQREARSPSLQHPAEPMALGSSQEQCTLQGIASAGTSAWGSPAQIFPQFAKGFKPTGWAWGEGGWLLWGLETCVTRGLCRLPGGDIGCPPAHVTGPWREESGVGFALLPHPLAHGEAQRWPHSQHRLQGWGGSSPPKPSGGIRSLIVQSPPSCWGIRAGTWTSLTSCGGSADPCRPAEESQASIDALLVVIFRMNIAFPLMVDISCALSLPQFSSLPAAGVLPGSGEEKKSLSEFLLEIPIGQTAPNPELFTKNRLQILNRIILPSGCLFLLGPGWGGGWGYQWLD